MTDKQKLEFVFWSQDVKVSHREGGFVAAGRRYYFDEAGELVKVEEV